jgi:hypothetical protein
LDEVGQLEARARELGIPTNSGIYKPMSETWKELAITPSELHRRVREEERHLRENSLHQLAVDANENAKSAIRVAWWAAAASVLSAVVALLALIYTLPI